MSTQYNHLHDWIMRLAAHGPITVHQLMRYPGLTDRAHVTGAAWELVRDGWLVYRAEDARFHRTLDPADQLIKDSDIHHGGQ